MRVLVTGAKGMLGTELLGAIQAGTGWDVVAADIEEFDITSPDSTAALVRDAAPDVIVNCVAYTNVDKAEEDRDLAFAVNGQGVVNLADAAGDARIVHISTDFVFSGDGDRFYTEEDAPAPLSVYGESKLEGERLLVGRRPDALVLRTAWLYGPHGGNFVATMLRLARERDELSVVVDECGSPTYTRDLAQAIIRGIHAGIEGLYHCTNRGCCSRHELATAAFELAGIDIPVREIRSAEWPRPARVPAYSPLDCTSLERALGWAMPDWRAALADYVRRVAGS